MLLLFDESTVLARCRIAVLIVVLGLGFISFRRIIKSYKRSARSFFRSQRSIRSDHIRCSAAYRSRFGRRIDRSPDPLTLPVQSDLIGNSAPRIITVFPTIGFGGFCLGGGSQRK